MIYNSKECTFSLSTMEMNNIFIKKKKKKPKQSKSRDFLFLSRINTPLGKSLMKAFEGRKCALSFKE